MLGVDLTTVTRALAEARRRGLVEPRGSLGTFVAAPVFELAQTVDLSMNVPPPPEGIDFDDMLRRGLAQVTLHADASLLMTYQLGGGTQPDREAGARGSDRCSAR
jgi:DNA-binding transcriptional MocR family regulator